MKHINSALVRGLSFDQRPQLLNQVTHIFDELINASSLMTGPFQTDLGNVKFNAYRKSYKDRVPSDTVVLDLFLPYAKKEDLDIETNESENTITVKVAAHQDPSVKETDYYVRQLSRSSSRTSLVFDSDLPVKNASADLDGGILRIEIPRTKESTQPNTRKIKIGR